MTTIEIDRRCRIAQGKGHGLTGASMDFANEFADRLAKSIGQSRFDLWFSDDVVFEFESNVELNAQNASTQDARAIRILVKTEDSFTLTRIQNQFGKTIHSVARSFHPIPEISYVVDAAAFDEPVLTQASSTVGDFNKNVAANGSGGRNFQADLDTDPVNAECQTGLTIANSPVLTIENQSPVATRIPGKLSSENTASGNLESAKQFSSSSQQPVSGRSRTKPRETQSIDFVFCENNHLARTICNEMLSKPGKISPVVFYGPTGSGKTILADMVKRRYRVQLNCRRMVMMSAEQFTSNYLGALNGQGLPMFRRHYRDLELLVIDDIQFFQGKKATTNEFQHTIDSLLNSGRQIILTSDRPPAELDFLSLELVTRLSGGLVCPVEYADEESRRIILKKFCQQRRYEFSDEVLEIIAAQMPHDMRRLSGAVNRLHMATVGRKRESISPEEVERILGDLFQVNSQNWSLRQIEKVVCGVAGVSPDEIRSSSRTQKVCTARMLAMWLSRKHSRAALSEIGDHYGGRSHSTVIAATKKMDTVESENASLRIEGGQYKFKDLVDRVRRQLKSG